MKYKLYNIHMYDVKAPFVFHTWCSFPVGSSLYFHFVSTVNLWPLTAMSQPAVNYRGRYPEPVRNKLKIEVISWQKHLFTQTREHVATVRCRHPTWCTRPRTFQRLKRLKAPRSRPEVKLLSQVSARWRRPASVRRSIIDFVSSAVSVVHVDMCQQMNKRSHFTSAYDTPNLVVRRGQEFLIRVTFSRPLGPNDDFQLEFRIGPFLWRLWRLHLRSPDALQTVTVTEHARCHRRRCRLVNQLSDAR